jgi:hypothetical protein
MFFAGFFSFLVFGFCLRSFGRQSRLRASAIYDTTRGNVNGNIFHWGITIGSQHATFFIYNCLQCFTLSVACHLIPSFSPAVASPEHARERSTDQRRRLITRAESSSDEMNRYRYHDHHLYTESGSSVVRQLARNTQISSWRLRCAPARSASSLLPSIAHRSRHLPHGASSRWLPYNRGIFCPFAINTLTNNHRQTSRRSRPKCAITAIARNIMPSTTGLVERHLRDTVNANLTAILTASRLKLTNMAAFTTTSATQKATHSWSSTRPGPGQRAR